MNKPKLLRYSTRQACENCKHAEYGTLEKHGIVGPKFAECTGFCQLSEREDGGIDFLIKTGLERCRFSENEIRLAIEQFEQRKIKKKVLENV